MVDILNSLLKQIFFKYISLKEAKTKSSEITDLLFKNSDHFFGRLKSCLLLQSKYKESFRNLRDALGGNQALSGFQSSSSSVLNSELSINLKDFQFSTSVNSKQGIAYNLNRHQESMKIGGIDQIIFL